MLILGLHQPGLPFQHMSHLVPGIGQASADIVCDGDIVFDQKQAHPSALPPQGYSFQTAVRSIDHEQRQPIAKIKLPQGWPRRALL